MGDWRHLYGMIPNGLLRGFFRRMRQDIVNEIQNMVMTTQSAQGIGLFDLRVHPDVWRPFAMGGIEPGPRRYVEYNGLDATAREVQDLIKDCYPPTRVVADPRMGQAEARVIDRNCLIVIARSYLECERVRFGARLDVAYEVVFDQDARITFHRIPAAENTVDLYCNLIREFFDSRTRRDRTVELAGPFRNHAHADAVARALDSLRDAGERGHQVPRFSNVQEYIESVNRNQRNTEAARERIAEPQSMPARPPRTPRADRPRLPVITEGAVHAWHA